MSAQHELEHGPSDAISSVAFSPSADTLAVASWDRTVSLYTRAPDSTSSEPYTLTRRVRCRAPVLDVCFGANDSSLYAVGLDHDVRDISQHNPSSGDTDSEVEQTVLSTHEAASNKLAYSSAHDLLLSTSWDSTLHVHNPGMQTYIRIRLPAKPFALSLSSTRAVIAMSERRIFVYALSALKALLEQTGSTQSHQQILDLEPWQQRESSLRFMARALSCMPDDAGFAISSIEGRVGVEWFDTEEQAKAYAFKCHRRTQTAMVKKESEEGGEADGDEEEEEEIDVVYPVNAICFNPIHGTFATGGGDGVVVLWDAQTRRRIRQYPDLGASVAAMDFSADGRYLAVGVSPGFEDGTEDASPDTSLVRVIVRRLAEDEAKGKQAKSK